MTSNCKYIQTGIEPSYNKIKNIPRHLFLTFLSNCRNHSTPYKESSLNIVLKTPKSFELIKHNPTNWIQNIIFATMFQIFIFIFAVGAFLDTYNSSIQLYPNKDLHLSKYHSRNHSRHYFFFHPKLVRFLSIVLFIQTSAVATEITNTNELKQTNTNPRRLNEQSSKYIKRISGFCSNGDGGIATKQECEEAARSVEWSDKIADSKNSWVYPPGCFQGSSRGRLFFNEGNQAQTSKEPCTMSRPCLCQMICKVGTYQDEPLKEFCKDCKEGTYNNQIAQSKCKEDCGAGSYTTADRTTCSVCEIGKWQNQEMQTSCKDDCSAGSFISSDKTACSACAVGLYQNENDQSSCKNDCGAGSYITADKTKCSLCDKGKWQDQIGRASCISCGTGLYNDLIEQKSIAACKNDCNAGSYITADKNACLNCPKGFWQNQNGQSVCISCRKGRFGNNQAGQNIESDCVSCPTAKYNALISQFQSTACKTCASNQEPTGDKKACVLIGRHPIVYNPTKRSTGTCIDGIDNLFIASKESCDEAAKVLELIDTAADIVSYDFYPAGCYLYSNKLYFNTDNTSTIACANDKTCLCSLTCSAGTYQDQTEQLSCKKCVETYSLSGRSSCKYDATTCPKGTYASGTATVCDACKAGTYNALSGQTSETACKRCEVGKYYDNHNAVGEISESMCKSCNKDEEPTGDQKGCVLIGQQPIVYDPTKRVTGVCTDVHGHFNIETIEECKQSVVAIETQETTTTTTTKEIKQVKNSFNPFGCFQMNSIMNYNTMLTSVTPCSSAFQCHCKLTCQPGFYQDQTMQTTCKTCQGSTYQNVTGKSFCKNDCGAGSFITADKSACSKCPQGTYQDQDDQFSCKSCDIGTYTNQLGQIGCKDDCSAGSFILFDKSACVKCPKGAWNDEKKKTVNCKSCKIGKYSDQIGFTSESDCKDCTVGRYNGATGLAKLCQECEFGKYNGLIGQIAESSCLQDCGKGFFITEDKSACVKCEKGFWQDLEDQSICKSCLGGKYNPLEGSVVESACVSCGKNF